jgi:membrane-bound metal-dependent hydrolase YbcI (DUF457 family)
VLDLPIALAVFWTFEYVIKEPGIALLPDELRLRLIGRTRHYSIGNPAQFAMVLVSSLLGIASHIAWDAFTHPRSWFYRHWPLLSEKVEVAPRHIWEVYKLFQNISTVLGTAIVLAWIAWWYWRTPPATEDRAGGQPGWILWAMLVVASVGALIRGAMNSHGSRRALALITGFTFILVLWWELVAWGVIFRMRQRENHPTA